MAAVYTTAQRDALAKAMATGVLTVTHEGHTTTYRSLADMERLLGIMNGSLPPPDGTAGAGSLRRLRVVTTKGLY